jgi:hypothetical protein
VSRKLAVAAAVPRSSEVTRGNSRTRESDRLLSFVTAGARRYGIRIVAARRLERLGATAQAARSLSLGKQ